MKITCNSCGKKINIPDEKIPQGRSFSVVCPHCKGKVNVEQERDSSTNPPKEADSSGVSAEQYQPPGDDVSLDFAEEGQKTAMVCDDNNSEAIKSALKELDYRVSIASSSEDAINRMKFTLYDIIILNEEFDNSMSENNKVLKYIQPISMPIRRKIFFVMVGNNFRTFDNMTAFAKSANLVINTKDLPNFKSIIKKSVSDNEVFYKVFKETLRGAGKM